VPHPEDQERNVDRVKSRLDFVLYLLDPFWVMFQEANELVSVVTNKDY
jgi:hypothetical protein